MCLKHLKGTEAIIIQGIHGLFVNLKPNILKNSKISLIGHAIETEQKDLGKGQSS